MQRMQRWLACLLCCFSFGSMAENIGVSELAVSSRFSDRLVMARIWYPAGENAAGERVSVGGNAVFAGVAAQADAAVSAGRFPLVVISHGGLQSAPDNISWLAAALAGQGYLVAVVNAPQVRGSNMTPPDELWLRPLDISAAIAAKDCNALSLLNFKREPLQQVLSDDKKLCQIIYGYINHSFSPTL